MNNTYLLIISLLVLSLCISELFQSKRLVLTVSRLPQLNIENLWYYRDDRHPHTGVIFLLLFARQVGVFKQKMCLQSQQFFTSIWLNYIPKKKNGFDLSLEKPHLCTFIEKNYKLQFFSSLHAQNPPQCPSWCILPSR